MFRANDPDRAPPRNDARRRNRTGSGLPPARRSRFVMWLGAVGAKAPPPFDLRRKTMLYRCRGSGGNLMKAHARAGVSGIAWAIVPAALLFVLFFALPFGVMAALSLLSGNPVSNPNVAFTWRNYARLVHRDLYLDVLIATLRIGVVVTALALLIGYPLAHWMASLRSRLGHGLLLMAGNAPMLTGT